MDAPQAEPPHSADRQHRVRAALAQVVGDQQVATGRIGVIPLACSPVAGSPAVHCRLLNSKSMLVVPDGSCTRDQKRLRKPVCWCRPPGRPRRTSGRSCSAGCCRRPRVGRRCPPWCPGRTTRRSAPVGESALRISVTSAQSMDGAASSTMRLASVSISKLLPGSDTSGCVGERPVRDHGGDHDGGGPQRGHLPEHAGRPCRALTSYRSHVDVLPGTTRSLSNVCAGLRPRRRGPTRRA